jgi:hypothetical protein
VVGVNILILKHCAIQQFSSYYTILVDNKMWMCYAEQSWTRAVDKYTAVERLVQQFDALQFDAEHEAVYGNGCFSPEYCEELAEKYRKGSELCQQFLDGHNCGFCLIKNLIELDLMVFITQLSEFFPEVGECDSDGSVKSDENESKI